ncbi:MAG: tyrosine-type recombinase/integrase [Desulfomonilaceae bacterium]
MAVSKRNGSWFIYFNPFKEKLIGIKLLNVSKEKEAKAIEDVILLACRSGDYSGLDLVAREACIRMFKNQGWKLPYELEPCQPKKEFTLWDACKFFVKYPEIEQHPSLERYEYALANVVNKLGKHTPINSIRVSRLKTYRLERLTEHAAPGTINWEMSALSKLFGVLIESDLTDTNPVRLIKRLSVKSGEREVYLSFEDVNRIAEHCPDWFRPLIWTAYYTGMRRGEILGLKRTQVNLPKRMIYLNPDQTKEGYAKRVPIHENLVPILREVLKITSIGTDNFFLIQDNKGVRPIGIETFNNCVPRACKALKLQDPRPRFHDLRHTWRTNARRSGVDAQIAESIMGHWFKGKSVNDRYGRISKEELLDSVDKMTFDHGDTEIVVYNSKNLPFRRTLTGV